MLLWLFDFRDKLIRPIWQLDSTQWMECVCDECVHQLWISLFDCIVWIWRFVDVMWKFLSIQPNCTKINWEEYQLPVTFTEFNRFFMWKRHSDVCGTHWRTNHNNSERTHTIEMSSLSVSLAPPGESQPNWMPNNKTQLQPHKNKIWIGVVMSRTTHTSAHQYRVHTQSTVETYLLSYCALK